MIRLSACVSLPLGEDDALRRLVADGRLGFLVILGRRIEDVTKVRVSLASCTLGAQR